MTFQQFIASYYLASIAITIATFNTIMSVDVALQGEIGILVLISSMVFMAYAEYTLLSQKSFTILHTILSGLFTMILIIGLYLHFGIHLNLFIAQLPKIIIPTFILFIIFSGLQKLMNKVTQAIKVSVEANQPQQAKFDFDTD